jgi:uncharacterized protein (DUF2236 family)
MTARVAAATKAAPLGPDSLTWRLGFARTALLYAGRSLVLQVAHPVVGAGVRDFSAFRADPWGRLERTLDSLLLQLFGGPKLYDEAARLKEVHRSIKGVGFGGERYSALQPEAWAWVHLSNFDSASLHFDEVVRPLTLAEKRQHYREWRQIGLVLGIKDAELPDAYDDVADYVEGMVRDRLTANPTTTTTDVLDTLRLAGVPPPYPLLPAPVWAALKPAGRTVLRDFTVGTLPPLLRHRMGLPWAAADEQRLDRMRAVVRTMAKAVPDRLMHYPLAYRAVRAGRAGQSAAGGST